MRLRFRRDCAARQFLALLLTFLAVVHRLGILSRRQLDFRCTCCRRWPIHPHLVASAAGEIANFGFIVIYAARVWFAPIARRSRDTITKPDRRRQNSFAWRCGRCFLYATAARACVRDSRNPAAQANSFLSGSDEQSVENLVQFLCATRRRHLLAVPLNFAKRKNKEKEESSIPCNCSRPARFYQPMYSNDSRNAGCRADPQPVLRHCVHGTPLAIVSGNDFDRSSRPDPELAMSCSTSH